MSGLLEPTAASAGLLYSPEPVGRGEVFQFGEFILNVQERRLQRAADAVRLAPKAFDLLVALLRHPGRLVSKDELLARVWPDSFVEEGILAVHVSALRRTLGDETTTYIETVARSGYRFVAPVRYVEAPDGDAPALSAVVRPVELYECVGRGRSHLLAASYFDVTHAVAAFRAATEIDPTYAHAHAGLARALCAQAELRTVPHLEAFAEAKALALRALSIDSACVDAHVALGTVLFLSEWDWPAAERSLRRALALDPLHTEGLVQYGALMEALGKLDEGLQFKQQALVRHRRSPWLLVQIATSYWHQRKLDEAVVWAQRALELDAQHFLAVSLLSSVHWRRGDFVSFLEKNLRDAPPPVVPDEALTHLRQIAAEMRSVSASEGLAGLKQYMADALTDPRLEFDFMLKLAGRRAIFYGDAGRLDDAFDCLDQAIASRDPALVYLTVAPQWDSLREDPRFGERLKRLALA
jgi:DNA-binding winged helix-turn-helix (wHTH) protein/Tfp pilus assembly protein PilF